MGTLILIPIGLEQVLSLLFRFKLNETMKKTSIIIADDHTLFSDGLEQIISTMKGFEVIAKVTDGKMLLQKINKKVPDMILMDVNMPYFDGIEAAKKIIILFPDIKIIFISMYNNQELIEKARKMAVSGYIFKDITAPVLKETILNVKNGIQVLPQPSEVVHQQNFKNNKEDIFIQFKLSPRELDILNLIKTGKSSKQMASILELSIYTIETHRKNIYRKLNVQSTAELVAFVHKWLK